MTVPYAQSLSASLQRRLTKEGTGRKNRDNERVVGRREGSLAWTFDELDENLGSRNTVDVAGIVTEEDTTKGSKSAPVQ